MVKTTSTPALELETYEIIGVERLLTPALAIYMDIVDRNIETMVELLGGEAQRWRPHIKTSKIAKVMSRLIERGVRHFKCATTLELRTLCELGAADVLMAYPSLGARGRRVRDLASQFPKVRVSTVVDSIDEIEAWRGSPVDLFIDINPGMDRTGTDQMRDELIITLAQTIKDAEIRFRGLHYYDGHHRQAELNERTRAAHAGYDQLLGLIRRLESQGIRVEEVITAGTPALPCSLSYSGFHNQSFFHRVSPGTVVYGDMTSRAQLPADWDFRPAALVVSTIVSQPTKSMVTCDAGHKTVSADAGIPNCEVLGHPEMEPQPPSEEHLPLKIRNGSAVPKLGSALYLLPRHICPTVNNFDHALLVEKGQILGVTDVTARGRENPLSTSRD